MVRGHQRFYANLIVQISSSDELLPAGMKGPTSSPTSGLAPASLAAAAAPTIATDRHRPGVLGTRQEVPDRSPEQMQVLHVQHMCIVTCGVFCRSQVHVFCTHQASSPSCPGNSTYSTKYMHLDQHKAEPHTYSGTPL